MKFDFVIVCVRDFIHIKYVRIVLTNIKCQKWSSILSAAID